MRLGFMISSGGSAFEEAARIAGVSGLRLTVVTVGECGAETVARRLGVEQVRIEGADRRTLSTRAFEAFSDRGVERCLLFLDRLVSAELFERIATFNIHPAILPAFPGRRGVEDAYAAQARLLGCSLHKVDASTDGGPLVAQIARGADPSWPIARWQKMAFLMKVYCCLVWMSVSRNDAAVSPAPLNASHGLPETWMTGFLRLQSREDSRVI